jgi:hypothetical protein
MRTVALNVLEGEFAVWKLPLNSVLPLLSDAPLLSITRTTAELSVVGPADLVPDGVPVEGGWACLEVQGPLVFELTGVLAAISAPLAAAGVPIFVISTFDTDYVLVHSAHLERAVEALRVAGHLVEA